MAKVNGVLVAFIHCFKNYKKSRWPGIWEMTFVFRLFLRPGGCRSKKVEKLISMCHRGTLYAEGAGSVKCFLFFFFVLEVPFGARFSKSFF